MRRVYGALCLLLACGESPGSEADPSAAAQSDGGRATRAEADAASANVPVKADAGDEASPVAAECVGRRSGELFCVDSDVRVCTNSMPSSLETCGPLQRCVMQANGATCACAPGAIETNGQCSAVDDCARAGGGCDPLTTCSMLGGQRTCGACPAGYAGDGERGCAPLLHSLAIEEGTLDPAFLPEVMSYRVQLSAAREQLVAHVTAVSNVEIEINGAEIADDGTWTSPKLSAGEQKLTVALTSRTGVTTKYEVVIEHANP